LHRCFKALQLIDSHFCLGAKWLLVSLTQWFSTFLAHGPSKKNPMDHFKKIVLHISLFSEDCNSQERFIKGLWNFLWSIRNSRWITGGPHVPRWESLI